MYGIYCYVLPSIVPLTMILKSLDPTDLVDIQLTILSMIPEENLGQHVGIKLEQLNSLTNVYQRLGEDTCGYFWHYILKKA